MPRLLVLTSSLVVCALIMLGLALPFMPLSTDMLLFLLAFGQAPLLVVALGLLSWSIVHARRMEFRYRMAAGRLPPYEMARHARWMASRAQAHQAQRGR